MNAPTDFTTDEGLVFLAHLKAASALPDWVEGVPETEDLRHLPTSCFADTANRLWPIHSKAAAFISSVASFSYGKDEGAWVNRLKLACHSYGIVDEVKTAHAALAADYAMLDAPAEVQKVACALELVEGPGCAPTGYYPMHTNHAVETSMDKLAEDIRERRLPESYFAEAAEKLVKAAFEFGFTEKQIPRRVRELGEVFLPSPGYLEQQVVYRQKQAGFPDEVAEMYRDAAINAIDKEASITDAAHFWELADMKFGVKVAGAIVAPVKAFKSGRTVASVEKEARAVCLISDIMVPYRNLLSLAKPVVAASFEKAAAAAILQAMNAQDGIEASEKLASVGPEDQLQLLALLTDIHGHA